MVKAHPPPSAPFRSDVAFWKEGASAMRTMFAMGFQPARRAFFLGQLLSDSDRNHYLSALTRGLSEADEIDAWLKANPDVKLNLPADNPDKTLSVSPYYTKYFNFTKVRPDMQKLHDRLGNTDPSTWSSLTQDEHPTFGWVAVLDQVYAAFKDDPKNLTVGHWQGGTRLPDQPSTAAATPPPASAEPTILGIPQKTALIGGGAVLGTLLLVTILS